MTDSTNQINIIREKIATVQRDIETTMTPLLSEHIALLTQKPVLLPTITPGENILTRASEHISELQAYLRGGYVSSPPSSLVTHLIIDLILYIVYDNLKQENEQ